MLYNITNQRNGNFKKNAPMRHQSQDPECSSTTYEQNHRKIEMSQEGHPDFEGRIVARV